MALICARSWKGRRTRGISPAAHVNLCQCSRGCQNTQITASPDCLRSGRQEAAAALGHQKPDEKNPAPGGRISVAAVQMLSENRLRSRNRIIDTANDAGGEEDDEISLNIQTVVVFEQPADDRD